MTCPFDLSVFLFRQTHGQTDGRTDGQTDAWTEMMVTLGVKIAKLAMTAKGANGNRNSREKHRQSISRNDRNMVNMLMMIMIQSLMMATTTKPKTSWGRVEGVVIVVMEMRVEGVVIVVMEGVVIVVIVVMISGGRDMVEAKSREKLETFLRSTWWTKEVSTATIRIGSITRVAGAFAIISSGVEHSPIHEI